MVVFDMKTKTFWKDEQGVTGVVEENGKRYHVELSIKGSQVIDYSCSCVNGNSYKGMCVHAKALEVEWKKQERTNIPNVMFTSQEVRTMIREYTNREVAKIMEEALENPIRLIPKLKIKGQDLFLECKLGRERTYQIKDLFSFVVAVKSGACVEYGKNLKFYHNIANFVSEDHQFLQFMIEYVTMYQEHQQQFQKSSYSTIQPMRSIALNKGMRDYFFSLMMEKNIEVEDANGTIKQVLVTKKAESIPLVLRKAGSVGTVAYIDREFYSFLGQRHLYMGYEEKLICFSKDASQILEVFIEQIQQMWVGKRRIDIQDRDMPLFYERVLKQILPYCTLQLNGVELEQYEPPELRAEFVFESKQVGEIMMIPTLWYGDYSFHPVEDENVPRTICRDVPREFKISQVITRYFKFREGEHGNLMIRNDDDGIYRLLKDGILEFMQLGTVSISESAKQMRILPTPKVEIGISTSGKWLDLTIDAEGISREELLKLLSEYQHKKTYHKLKNGQFLQLDQEGLRAVAQLLDGQLLNKNQLKDNEIRVPLYRSLYLNTLLGDKSQIRLYRDQFFKSVVRGMKSVEDSEYELPNSLRSVLRGYQRTGFRWLKTLDQFGFGGILADDMGLGKTIQVITLLLSEKHRNAKETSLIVCPASLVYNWENEIKKFAPELSVQTIVGTQEQRKIQLESEEHYDVAITSYDLLKRDIFEYQNKSFRFQVIDEAQYIKNPVTQAAKAVKAIVAKTKFALTGTPVENRLSELWSIFDYLMPGFLFVYPKFKQYFENPIVKEEDDQKLIQLKQMVGPFILRRKKEEVLKELPEKLETNLYAKMEAEQKKLYIAYAEQLKEQLALINGSLGGPETLQVLSQLTRLRQICCDPSLCFEKYKGKSAKLETCIEMVKTAMEGGHRILLFSQFTSMLDIIKKRLEKEQIEHLILTGATPKEERIHLVSQFQQQEIPIFLISLKAGGTGLNLTAADVVIHYDPWWNVAVQNQATDRAHRIGQEKQVNVWNLVAKNSIEENILKLQAQKQNLADQVLTGTIGSFGGLTKDELLWMLEEGVS